VARLNLATGELLTLVPEPPVKCWGQYGPLPCATMEKPAKGWAALAFPRALALSREGHCLVATRSALFQLILPAQPEAPAPAAPGSPSPGCGPATPARGDGEERKNPGSGS
jgi:hypothetical protein